MIKKGKTTKKEKVSLKKSFNDYLIDIYHKTADTPLKVKANKEKQLRNIKGDTVNLLKVMEKNKEQESIVLEELSKIDKQLKEEDLDAKAKRMFMDKFSNLKNNKLIKSVQFIELFENKTKICGYYSVENTLIIETNNLHYYGHSMNYDLGKYVIFMKIDGSGLHLPRVFSMDYKCRSYHHPCIDGGGVCYGTLGTAIEIARKNMDIDGLIFLLVNFLQEPNYETPYIDENVYEEERSKRTTKYEHITEFINSNFRNQ